MDTQFLPRTEAEKLFGFELYQAVCRRGAHRVVRVEATWRPALGLMSPIPA